MKLGDSADIWDAVVVGGGIAGCSAAIRLAQMGRRVLLLERRSGKPNKLCGEFLSPEAAGYLAQFGVLKHLLSAGARQIDQLIIAEPGGAMLSCPLPAPAIGISRSALDTAMLRRAQVLGAVCSLGALVDGIERVPGGFLVRASDAAHRARCVFGAYGKLSKLDGQLGRASGTGGFVAFKAHYCGIHAPRTIEMFNFRDGYCGCAPVEDGLVNICLIVHRRALACAGGKTQSLMEMAALENPALGKRLIGLRQESPMAGCSSITFATKGCFERGVCMIGDSAGMIAPLCGDGMSMAMQSAILATQSADQYLRGQGSFNDFQRGYTRAWKKEYTLRLAVGRILQQVSLSTTASSAALRLCRTLPGLRNFLIRSTRGRLREMICIPFEDDKLYPQNIVKAS